MPALSLNHIGIAVKDRSRVQRLFEILGMSVGHQEAVPEQGVNTFFMDLPVQPGHLELLEVTDPEGTVAKFMEKRGPGIHHLSFLAEKGELDALCLRLTQDGFKLIYAEPKNGAHQMRVNFIHPATAGGLLIEVMEPR